MSGCRISSAIAHSTVLDDVSVPAVNIFCNRKSALLWRLTRCFSIVDLLFLLLIFNDLADINS
jgi:hypothetical protein